MLWGLIFSPLCTKRGSYAPCFPARRLSGPVAGLAGAIPNASCSKYRTPYHKRTRKDEGEEAQVESNCRQTDTSGTTAVHFSFVYYFVHSFRQLSLLLPRLFAFPFINRKDKRSVRNRALHSMMKGLNTHCCTEWCSRAYPRQGYGRASFG